MANSKRTDQDFPLLEGLLVGDIRTGEWKLLPKEMPSTGPKYPIPIKELVSSPEELFDWMAQLAEKAWFDPKKFFSFFERFRAGER